MKRTRILLATLIFLVVLPSLFGQDVERKDMKDKEKGKETVVVKDSASPDVPVKVQILLTEFDGAQKISSLPYTIYTLASAPHSREHNAHLRFGVKVPITTSAGSGSQFTYQDVGTNIDCAALQFGDEQYSLDLTIERTSVSTRGAGGEELEWKPGNENPGPQPLLRSFRDNFMLIMRDGHTMEGTSAVDPVTGHVLKVEVTLNVLK
jgi:hypothetical protein